MVPVSGMSNPSSRFPAVAGAARLDDGEPLHVLGITNATEKYFSSLPYALPGTTKISSDAAAPAIITFAPRTSDPVLPSPRPTRRLLSWFGCWEAFRLRSPLASVSAPATTSPFSW